jgi:hypothetical protein
MSDTVGYVLCAICVVLVLLPTKWDPAIRIKKAQIKAGWHPESPTKEPRP